MPYTYDVFSVHFSQPFGDIRRGLHCITREATRGSTGVNYYNTWHATARQYTVSLILVSISLAINLLKIIFPVRTSEF